MSATHLIDTSAWTRIANDNVPGSRVDELVDDFVEGRLAVCMPFLLEAGYSARSGDEYAAISEELASLPSFSIDLEIEKRALAAQAQLARIGHHRVPLTDLTIAAIADRYEIGVLHYDKDFDVLLERTGLDFHSEWLMPRGSLD
jgi:predicted nucleic acid-binding protein